jgi:AraC-like DNA-binding protein
MAVDVPCSNRRDSCQGVQQKGLTVDVLSDVTQAIRLKGLISGGLELAAPWGMGVPERGHPCFYAVARGSCVVDVEGVKGTYSLAGGDLFFLPRSHAHVIRDTRRTRPQDYEKVMALASHDGRPASRGEGNGAVTALVAGCFSLDTGPRHPLLASLPDVIHLRADRRQSAGGLDATLQFIASEAASRSPGVTTVLSRLADILFVQIIRAHVAETGEHSGPWLRALADPQISLALQRIHAQPDAPWTVESLAREAAMSRSAFAARFTELVGEPVLAYLTRWRMVKAREWLAAPGVSVSEVASRVGYTADAAFAKAFKRVVGMGPGAFRKKAG